MTLIAYLSVVFVFFVIFAANVTVALSYAKISNRTDNRDAVNRNIYIEPVVSIKNITNDELTAATLSSPSPVRKGGRFLNTVSDRTSIEPAKKSPLSHIDNNEIDDEEAEKNDPDNDHEDPTAPLYGIYYDCLFRLSFSCVQRKLLVFLDRLGRLRSINLIGEVLSIVRNKKELGPLIDESDLEARLSPGEASSALYSLFEYNFERFLRSHVLRITLPAGITASVSGNSRSSSVTSTGNTIDINISRVLEETTGRGKHDKKMKKLMHMMMTGLMSKMAFLGPLMVLMIKLKAMKALLLSKLALMLSLMHMFKKKGGGHGKEVIIVHDAHGGHEGLTNSAWTTAGGGWSGTGNSWFGGQGDSYNAAVNAGAGDATYSASDTFTTGAQVNAAWAGGNTANAPGWGRRSSSDPHWVAYRAYIPDTDK